MASSQFFQTARANSQQEKGRAQVRRFQQRLENGSGKKLKVRINDNRSTMLSVRWESDHTRVSLHRMFLQAPRNVMEALACYLNGRNRTLAPSIKAFIEDNVRHLNYSDMVDTDLLSHRGRVYDLDELYREVNREYFRNKLDLHITWFGEHRIRNRSRVTFGLYHDPLKLVKIHRILDYRSVPRFLVKFVIYHEMLHAVCPPYVDENGINRIHSKEFKELETEFTEFEQAQRWIERHRGSLFSDMT